MLRKERHTRRIGGRREGGENPPVHGSTPRVIRASIGAAGITPPADLRFCGRTSRRRGRCRRCVFASPSAKLGRLAGSPIFSRRGEENEVSRRERASRRDDTSRKSDSREGEDREGTWRSAALRDVIIVITRGPSEIVCTRFAAPTGLIGGRSGGGGVFRPRRGLDGCAHRHWGRHPGTPDTREKTRGGAEQIVE